MRLGKSADLVRGVPQEGDGRIAGATGENERKCMLTVYRMQDAEGRGPWRPGMGLLWVEDRPDHDNLRTTLEEFGNFIPSLTRGKHFGCGCRTVEQMRRWFTQGEYRSLKRFGYRAVMLDVDRIAKESLTQLIFERDRPLREGAVEFNLYES